MPTENLHLQGRFDSYPKRRGITRVPELLDAGLKVAFGQDSIRDPWYPMGNGNLLRTLDVGLHACHMLGMRRSSGANPLRDSVRPAPRACLCAGWKGSGTKSSSAARG